MNKRITLVSVAVLALGATLVVWFGRPPHKPQVAVAKPHEARSFGMDGGGERTDSKLEFAGAPRRLGAVRPVPVPTPAASTGVGVPQAWARVVEIERVVGPDGHLVPLTEEEEAEAQVVIDNNSMQRVLRASYANQREDKAWTKQMEKELRQQEAELLAGNKVKIDDLSCRETICRMYLQFQDQLDAEAFKTAKRDPNLKFEFQSLDPAFQGDGFDRSNHLYEVLVQRPRPEGLPAHGPSENATGSDGDRGTAKESSASADAIVASANGE